MGAIITKHADKRRHERLGFSHEGLEHTLEKVLELGVDSSQVKGKIKKYLDALFFQGDKKANNIKLYGEFAYILRGETLITVLHIPNEFRSYKKYLKK